MSTRYVWNRYTIRNTVQYEETKIGEIDVGQEEILYTISGEPAASFDPLYYALVDSWEDYVENPITFPYTVENGQAITIPPRRCLIFSPSKSAQTVQDGAIIYYNPTSSISANVICTNSGGSWSIAKKGTGTFAGDVIQYRATITEQQEKGSLIGPISGPSQSSYPSDGVQGNYWYTSQGSDNIDPTAVTYPSGPKSGVPITITVTPRANTYGGTISYQYEYTLDGGNVWNQLALTTAASQQYTIPKGTQTFRVRVQARDNMGFTSSDWIYGPQVNVVNNSAPSAPPTITVPVSPRGGAQTTITWTASSDVDGNLAGYELERQLDGGSWTSLYTGEGLSYLDTIPKGTATAAYRVRAYDADGEYSGYTTSATRTVVNNNPPVITSSLSGDLGTKSAGFTVPYTVTDEEGGTVTVAEQVGNLVKRTHTPTLGQEQTFHVEDQDGDYFFTQILNGSQTVRITATDEGGLSSTLELSFTKAVHSMSVTLETPLEVEEAITVAIMSVLCGIPADASYQLLATNNAKDAEPVWQDVTADVAAGRNIIFTNQVQANGPAFNFKLSANRSEGGQGGYVKSLKGAFQ